MKQVLNLEDFFVTKVACGQMHSMCIANRKSMVEDNEESLSADSFVFTWGQGMLGQLGIGVRGTSKGRLVPTLNRTLEGLRIVDIACGDNFSVALSYNGDVYSWGHSEYNQHGQGSHASSDYTDPFHYFVPRIVEKISTGMLPDHEKIISIHCGAAFSVGVTNKGNCVSWGWNSGGVLGRGKGIISPEPNYLYSLGPNAGEDRIVDIVAVGSCQVWCSTVLERSLWASNHYSHFLDTKLEETADVELLLDGGEILLSHRAILGLRSAYFRGMINCALDDIEDADIHERRLQIQMPDVDVYTMTSLLCYLYTDRVLIPNHLKSKRKKLGLLASSLGISDLEFLVDFGTSRPPSTFSSDMQKGCSLSPSNTGLNFYRNSRISRYFANVFFYSKSQEAAEGKRTCLLCAHKFILCYFMPYFVPLFYGGFAESAQDDHYTWLDIDPFEEDGISLEIFSIIISHAYGGPSIIEAEEFEDTGENVSVSSIEVDLPDQLQNDISVLLGADRFGFVSLAKIYERKVFAYVKKSSFNNAMEAFEFAESFQFSSLAERCRHCITKIEYRGESIANSWSM